jgi:nanoRNase/pAp phosphatase (c-di-AMP/oligoRNAs hydrolase)
VLIADFFMRLTCVDWSVVSGIHEEKLVVIMRNDGIRKNAGKIARQSFGKIGSAGGHRSMSRAEIPLGNLPEEADPNQGKRIARWIIDQVEERTSNPAAGRSVPDMKKAIFGKGS